MLGLAPETARTARPAVELALRPARLLPGSLAAAAPLPRLPAAPPAGFSLGPPLVVSVAVDSVAAIHRVRGVCHVIVAPLVDEHGLADWWGGPRAWRSSRRRPRVESADEPYQTPRQPARPQDGNRRLRRRLDWMAQLRESAQRVADRIDALDGAAIPTPDTSRSTGVPAHGGEFQSQPMGPSGRACRIRRQDTFGAECLLHVLDADDDVR